MEPAHAIIQGVELAASLRGFAQSPALEHGFSEALTRRVHAEKPALSSRQQSQAAVE